MPYAPAATFDYKQLSTGLGNIGDAISEGAQIKRKSEETNGAWEFLTSQYPDLVSPEMSDKFHGESLGKREGMLGQLSASLVTDQKKRALDLEQMRTLLDYDQHEKEFDYKKGRDTSEDTYKRDALSQRNQQFYDDQARKIRAEADKNKVVITKAPGKGEIAMVNGQTVRGPQAKEYSIEPPAWAVGAMKGDKDLYWTGTHLAAKSQAYNPDGLGGPGAPPAAATGAAAPLPAPKPGDIRYHPTTGAPYVFDGTTWKPK